MGILPSMVYRVLSLEFLFLVICSCDMHLLNPYCVLWARSWRYKDQDSASPFKMLMVCEGDRHEQKPRTVSGMDISVMVFGGLWSLLPGQRRQEC